MPRPTSAPPRPANRHGRGGRRHALAKTPPARSARRRVARTHRFLVLASRFNQPMTQRLVDGALAALREAGASPRQIRTVWVPGAFELPAAAAHFASQHARPHAIIAVGAIIKGETMQYQALAAAVTQGLSQAAVTTGVPVTCGVVIAETAKQASARAGLPAPPVLRFASPPEIAKRFRGLSLPRHLKDVRGIQSRRCYASHGTGHAPHVTGQSEAKRRGQAGGSIINRGAEAAEAAIELLAVFSDRRTR